MSSKRPTATGADRLRRAPGPGALLPVAATAVFVLAGLAPTAVPAQAAAPRTALPRTALAATGADTPAPAPQKALVAVAQPAAYPPPGCSARVSTTIVFRGLPLVVQGSCFKPCSRVDIKFDDATLATDHADWRGAVTGIVTIPKGATWGAHTIGLDGVGPTGAPLTETARIWVLAWPR